MEGSNRNPASEIRHLPLTLILMPVWCYCKANPRLIRFLAMPGELKRSFLFTKTSFVLLKTSFVLPKTSFVLPKTSFVLPKTSFVLPKTSFVLLKTSFVLLKTSFVLPKTSNVLTKTSFVFTKTSFVFTKTSFVFATAKLVWAIISVAEAYFLRLMAAASAALLFSIPGFFQENRNGGWPCILWLPVLSSGDAKYSVSTNSVSTN
jgi:hypothetical protein